MNTTNMRIILNHDLGDRLIAISQSGKGLPSEKKKMYRISKAKEERK